MAGLYIHIPFCRKVCYYCDFHFTVSLKKKSQLIKAIVCEIQQREKELSNLVFDTIYVGGGTPTVLSAQEFEYLYDTVLRYCNISDDPEFTIEANPDDLNKRYISEIRSAVPVNRFSVGIQSFIDNDLRLLNRRHNAEDAMNSIFYLKDIGIENINVDLIYGLPWMNSEEWYFNLEEFRKLKINHLSAYHLNIEPKTVFGRRLSKGQIEPIDEDLSMTQFNILIEFTQSEGFEHYEISNFARKREYSKHNLGYWTGQPYIGIGPSAHSYDLNTRRWNISNNQRYIDSLEKSSNDYFETEIINTNTRFNDYILVSLRTMWGADLKKIEADFGEEYTVHLINSADKFKKNGYLTTDENTLLLTVEGKLVSDYIISELFMV
ncbi:MAG: radical SAM family heme chaperone HemW [Bacteroidales bacterium]|nr:radical SAM family heme chaperone HemW [Bacteroidales bacterium]